MNESRVVDELERRVVAARDGDEDAFAWLVDRYSGLAFATAYGWLGNAALAEEAVQDAFARVLTDLGALRTPAAFATWLRQVTVKCCDRITRKRSFPVAPMEAAQSLPATGDPETALAQADERERVRLAVEALPVEMRLPIVLQYLADLSTRDIAEVLAVPESTVKGRIQSGKQRLRSSFDQLVRDALRMRAPPAFPPVTPSTRLFLAIRAGDLAMVSRLLDADPSLVDAVEDWSPTLAMNGQLPFPDHGTPLLRAVGRGDQKMAALLLRRGAPLDRACACVVGETPLWAAVLSGDLAMTELLLRAGADPDHTAAHGQTALHVAAQRGDIAAFDLLRANGAATEVVDGSGRRPSDWTGPGGGPGPDGRSAILVTGIRVLDLLAPIEFGARVLWEGRAYVGQMAVLSEVSHNLARRSRCRVIWTGVPQGALDRVDLVGELAETGTRSDVHLLMGPSKQPSEVRRSVEEALAIATRLADNGDDVVVVLFVDPGVESCADLLVGHCRAGLDGSITGIAVTSWVGDRDPRLDATSFNGLIALDPELAARQVYPAIDVARSETSALFGTHVTIEHRNLARAMRVAILASLRSETSANDGGRAELSLQFVRQHFRTRQAVDNEPGVTSTLAETLARARDVVTTGP